MIHYFLEYLPPYSYRLKRSRIVALTPLACYQMDKSFMKYDLSENYAYPKRFDMEKIRGKLVNTRMSVFIEHCLQYEEASRYWDEFIENYIDRNKIERLKYYGSSLKYLKNRLLLMNLL